MISLFVKRENTNIVLEFNKKTIVDSVIDTFENQLLFSGSIHVNIVGVDDATKSSWVLTNETTKEEIGSYTGNQNINDISPGEYRVTFNPIDQYITPNPQQKILFEKQILNIIGQYVKNINIVITGEED